MPYWQPEYTYVAMTVPLRTTIVSRNTLSQSRQTRKAALPASSESQPFRNNYTALQGAKIVARSTFCYNIPLSKRYVIVKVYHNPLRLQELFGKISQNYFSYTGIDLAQQLCYLYITTESGVIIIAADNGQNIFRRGVTAMVILALLRREDMYGYQLVQETERASGGKLTTQEGSLYPVLYRLLEQGMISDHRVLVGKRMTRIYYHLEPAGEARLQELIREYEDTTQGVFRIIQSGGEKENDQL